MEVVRNFFLLGKIRRNSFNELRTYVSHEIFEMTIEVRVKSIALG